MAPSADLPGFRFHPTDVELVVFYLKGKVMGRPSGDTVISEIDIYKSEPWDLPAQSRLKSKDLQWYFFCPRGRKYANSKRANRSTHMGYWKSTGKDRPITHKSRTVGMKKTLIFHFGNAPRGVRTDWVMYEYRLDDKTSGNTKFSQDAYTLCKIFEKSGPGSKNGEQYGAPFDEEEWEHFELSETAICLPSLPCPSEPPPVVLSEPVVHQPEVGDDDDAGSWMAYLDGILNSSPLHWESEGETSVSLAVQPLMSELGDDDYMERNDFRFLENMADAVDTTRNINSLTMLSDFLPHPGTFSDLSRLIQEVDERGSCSKQSDLDGCQLEDVTCYPIKECFGGEQLEDVSNDGKSIENLW